MFRRALGAATFVAAVLLAAGLVQAQAPAAKDAKDAKAAATPRTPWGHPDLQGTWDYRTITPLERPREFGES